ncbi:ABC transporter substrate-binding protein (plasmid) [Rathayibacter sp. VKM Ac-2803]|uniref:ABC transporter substrate-binding protein n=1 Tax=Rathayibacter caricis DSM 15933 TaxID=1328867 RepID=A0A2T4UPC2_9MICO|nr:MULTISPECIES: ABC transporter substrate-binding protein [Rathayibacter]MWV51544.1 ABC transporter substrate-binding protein [Rathayibacter sp. VKM Ac-2803]PTL71364.1 ABC transporter substrate-binding protein [Rathayibacter caricis DSM 15933]
MQSLRASAGSSRGWRLAAAAAVVVATLSVSACSPGGGGTETGGGQAPTELTIPVARQPSQLDPVSASSGTDGYIWKSVYDTLVFTGPDGEYEPRAATEWSFSEDGLTMNLTLRDDLVFSDGTPATANDLKATLERIRDTPGPSQREVEGIASIEVTSDTALTLTLSQPDPSLLRKFTGPAGIIAKAGELAEPGYGQNPIGSGPYILDLEASTPGAEYVLTKRDDHWNADNYPFSTVTVRVIEDSTALENALRSGEVDVAPSVLPASRASLESVPGIEISEVENTSQQTLIIADRDGTIQPALADVRVRQAINMAFDRENIVANAMNGLGAPSEQVFYPTFDAFDEALNDTYEYDVEGAKDLLAEAGYPDGFSVTMPSIIYSGQLEPVVGQALADIGIDVTWQPIPAQDTVTAITSKSFPLVVWPDGNDPDGTVAFGHFSPQGFLNPFGSEDPELTEMLTRARAAVSAEEASAVYQEINEWGVENAWSAPIVKSHSLVAAREGYAVVNTSYQIAPTLDQFDVSE